MTPDGHVAPPRERHCRRAGRVPLRAAVVNRREDKMSELRELRVNCVNCVVRCAQEYEAMMPAVRAAQPEAPEASYLIDAAGHCLTPQRLR
jgi:hypothetical protein